MNKCPECGEGELLPLIRTEEFDFDLGVMTVKVRAENVPVQECDKCGEVLSGPAAARVRQEAICRAAGLVTLSDVKALRTTGAEGNAPNVPRRGGPAK